MSAKESAAAFLVMLLKQSTWCTATTEMGFAGLFLLIKSTH